MTDEGYYELAKAIILQAVKDFRGAYMILKKHPDHPAAAREVKEIAAFFASEYFSLLSDLNGLRLLRKIKQEIDEKIDGKIGGKIDGKTDGKIDGKIEEKR